MNDTIKFLGGVVLAGVYIAGLVVLTWHGSIDGATAVAAAAVPVGTIIGAAIHGNGVDAGATAAGTPTPAPASHAGLPE